MSTSVFLPLDLPALPLGPIPNKPRCKTNTMLQIEEIHIKGCYFKKDYDIEQIKMTRLKKKSLNCKTKQGNYASFSCRNVLKDLGNKLKILRKIVTTFFQ